MQLRKSTFRSCPTLKVQVAEGARLKTEIWKNLWGLGYGA